MTIFLILLTAAISILAFNNRELFGKMQFNAYQVVKRNEFYRLLTHGFIHANWPHLIVNMLVLYFFGDQVEMIFRELSDNDYIGNPLAMYLIFYLAAIVVSSSVSLVKHKDDIWYNAVGASGAVSAALFFCIFFYPWELLYFYGIIPLPGIVFGVLYIVYSQYMIKRGNDNIGHEAHLLGAVFGFIFPLFIDLGLYKVFLNQLLSFSF